MKSVEGLVLKKTPRRESDAVFTLYTKEHGLMELQAKSVRKGTAKLKSGLDAFNHLELFYAPAKYLPIATDFKIKNDFKNIKQDLFRLKLANLAGEVVLKIFEPGLAEPKVWQKNLDFFCGLNNNKSSPEKLVQSAYIWCYHILALNGLNPQISFKDSADFKKITQASFQYHFGLDLISLI